jgi:tetratricopeptide (TPR) repeat protein
MAKNSGRAIRPKAIAELERLSVFLDEAFDITENMTTAEIDEELRAIGVDPHRLPPLNLSRILSGKAESYGAVCAFASKGLAYAFVAADPIRAEAAADEVKLLILRIRTLSRQRRYDEALKLVKRVTALAPDYWRGWINYASLLVLSDRLDEGEAIYRRTRQDFSDDPKAVAAALHGWASVKEIRCRLSPSGENLREVSRLYEEALEFDDSRTNTRACLVINSFLSRQPDRGKKLFEDSLLCEGFIDEMSLEIRERGAREDGAKVRRVAQAFPVWFRNLLGGAGTGAGVAF